MQPETKKLVPYDRRRVGLVVSAMSQVEQRTSHDKSQLISLGDYRMEIVQVIYGGSASGYRSEILRGRQCVAWAGGESIDQATARGIAVLLELHCERLEPGGNFV